MKPHDCLAPASWATALFLAFQTSASVATAAATHPPDQTIFRDLYRELVETSTTLSTGSCTEAAEKMAARLRSTGFADDDLHLIVAPEHPREGNLVAVMKGTDAKLPAIQTLGSTRSLKRRGAWCPGRRPT